MDRSFQGSLSSQVTACQGRYLRRAAFLRCVGWCQHSLSPYELSKWLKNPELHKEQLDSWVPRVLEFPDPYREHVELVFNHLYHQLRNNIEEFSDEEDDLQESLRRIFCKAKAFATQFRKSQGNRRCNQKSQQCAVLVALERWLQTVMENIATDRLRRRWTEVKHRRQVAQVVGLKAFESEIYDPERRAIGKEVKELLLKVVEHLPSEEREAVTLRCLKGETLTDIAKRLGKSVSAISRAMGRGCDRLRFLLRQRGIGSGDDIR